MIKHLKNNGGFTLVELIVTMFIMALVMTSVSASLISFSNHYSRINFMAETNDTLDSIAKGILSDLRDADGVETADGRIAISFYGPNSVEYYTDGGLLYRTYRIGEEETTESVLPPEAYKDREIEGIGLLDRDGNAVPSGSAVPSEFILNVTLVPGREDGGSVLSRGYAVKPLGMTEY